jgi:hypothetical protein
VHLSVIVLPFKRISIQSNDGYWDLIAPPKIRLPNNSSFSKLRKSSSAAYETTTY